MTSKEIARVLHHLDPDDATDLIQILPKRKGKVVLTHLHKEMKKKVEYLLKFDPKTAAGLMSLEYIQVTKHTTFKKLSTLLRKHERRTGKFPAILVENCGDAVGELPGYVLALAHSDEKIEKYVKHIPHLYYNDSEEKILKVFHNNRHNKIVVLDEDKSVMGVIYADDILALIEKKSGDSLQEFAGISDEEDVLDSPFKKVKHRYKWLIINLATAFLAASVVGLFQETISAVVLLAVYMPIVAGMGGNSATQALVVAVRGLTLGEVSLKTGRKVIVNEMIAGGVNGLINGLLVAIIATLWHQSPLLGLVVGLAMIINLINAGLFGAFVPLFMNRIGKDPATSATIFITTATDVIGFFVFLELATLLLL